MVNELLGIQYNIVKANRTDRKVQNLASYINEDTLKAVHKTMDKGKAYGIDKVTKEDYERNLEENLANLVKRMKSGSYRPNPTRRVYIPKETKGKMRPLGISCYEDKLVENAIAQILEQIYEPKFYNESFGFRPNRNCHQAVREKLRELPEIPDAVAEKTLIGKILSLKKLDRKLADITVKNVDVFKDGTLKIEWNFSGMFDSMFPQDLLDTLPKTNTLKMTRTWIYYCTVDGWDRLNEMRSELFAYADERDWIVIGDSFDNSKPCLEANGFRQMREAVRQGRVDNILVYTLDGLPKKSKNYERFKRQIEKRHICMYDRKGNLLIGA